MATRTGHIGSCYEYSAQGKRMAGNDQMTIDGMLDLSQKWPDTYHQYVRDDLVVWAKNGQEIPAPAFAR